MIPTSSPTAHSQTPPSVILRKRDHIVAATGNLALDFDAKRIFSLIRIDPLPIPRPIAINHLLSFLSPSTHSCALGEIRSDTATGASRLSCSLFFVLSEHSRRKEIAPTSARASFKRKLSLDLDPLQLSENQNKYMAQTKEAAHHKSRPYMLLPSPPLNHVDEPAISPSYRSPHPLSDPAQNDISLRSPPISDLEWSLDPPNPNPEQEIRNEDVSLGFNQTTPSQEEARLILPVSQLRKAKKNRVPTRRSSRIQEKQSQNTTAPKPPPNPKSHSTKIPFNLKSHEMPLDVDAAMSILQATGLQITQQVEDMIQQAAKEGAKIDVADTDESRPTTPLHDHIPPRVVPGEPIVL